MWTMQSVFFVAGMNIPMHSVPPNHIRGVAYNNTPQLSSLFTPPSRNNFITGGVGETKDEDTNSSDHQREPAAQLPRDAGRGSPGIDGRNGKLKGRKRKPRKKPLPAVVTDDQGEVYLSPNDASRQQPRRLPRNTLPPVSRNSVGDVYVPTVDRRQRVTEPNHAESEVTPSSLLFDQIDDIYGQRRTSRHVPQYFGDRRPSRHDAGVASDDLDHPVNEEGSVKLDL